MTTQATPAMPPLARNADAALAAIAAYNHRVAETMSHVIEQMVTARTLEPCDSDGTDSDSDA